MTSTTNVTMNTALKSTTIDDLNKKYIDIAGVEQTFKTKKSSFCALQNVNLQVANNVFIRVTKNSISKEMTESLSGTLKDETAA